MNTSQKIAQFFSQFPSKTYSNNQILIWANEDPKHIFYIIKGRIRQYRILDNGRKVAVNTFKTGAFMPMSWAMNKTPNHYFFESIEETEVYVAPPKLCLDFLKSNPDVTYDLLRRVFIGADAILERTVQLMDNSARKRVIIELLSEYQRFTDQKIPTKIALTESDIAVNAGLSRESVNRQFKILKDKKIIKVSSNSIMLIDPDQLQNQLYEQ